MVFFNVAEPPTSDNRKSSRSKVPVALALEKTGTLNRTITFLLSESNFDSDITGALRSNKVTLLMTCVWAASVPDASYNPSSAKPMINSSDPSAIPVNGSPKIYVKVLSIVFNVFGCCCERVEVPLLIFKMKAVESRLPVPSLALNVGSFIVTVSVELSVARSSLVINGAFLSLNVTLFLFCSILAGFPDPSNTALSTINTERTSVPLGSPREPIPRVNVLPDLAILVGKGEVKTIVSPVTEKTKSLFSRSPVPLPLL